MMAGLLKDNVLFCAICAMIAIAAAMSVIAFYA